MIRHLSRFDALSVGLLSGVALVTAGAYARLPARVPVHFAADGLANGWASRPVGAWALPVTGVAIWVFLRVLRALLPSSWTARLRDAPMAAVAFILAAFFSAAQVMTLHAALEPSASIARPMSAALGVLWIAIAQVLPRVRRNRILGVRTPWTLSSHENWLRTHRVAAHAFNAAGAVSLAAAILLARGALVVTIVATLVSALVPTVYSYVLAQRLPKEP